MRPVGAAGRGRAAASSGESNHLAWRRPLTAATVRLLVAVLRAADVSLLVPAEDGWRSRFRGVRFGEDDALVSVALDSRGPGGGAFVSETVYRAAEWRDLERECLEEAERFGLREGTPDRVDKETWVRVDGVEAAVATTTYGRAGFGSVWRQTEGLIFSWVSESLPSVELRSTSALAFVESETRPV